VTLFVDTSIFYAAADRSDRGNARAKAIIAGGDRLLTTDHVLIETWLLIQRRLGANAADRFWASARAGAVAIESVEAADLERAWGIGESFPDQAFSIVDRTSFAVLQRIGVNRVASFDQDFAIYRYGSRRERAFEIVA
jgi:predicted nucleic acid-binding protein